MIRSKEVANLVGNESSQPAEQPKFAYDLEGQELVVARAQREGELTIRRVCFTGLGITRELGHRWYLLHHNKDPITTSTAHLLAVDCNGELIEGLREGDILTLIKTPDSHPEAFFGRSQYAIAAVLRGDGVIIYKSPGFDLDAWQASQQVSLQEPSPEPQTQKPRLQMQLPSFPWFRRGKT